MTLKQRLYSIERKAGRGDQPTVVYTKTIYEGQNPGDDFRFAMKAILSGRSQFHCVEADQAETDEQFKERVRAMCLKLYGQLPFDQRKHQGLEVGS